MKTAIFAVVLSLIAAVAWARAPKVKVDVAIVGGGSAGRYLAVRAKDLGLTTATFELSGRTGGQCDPVPNGDGTFAQMGVADLLDTALSNQAIGTNFRIDSRAYIERFIAPSDLENIGYASVPDVKYLFDARTSFLFPAPAPSAAQQLATAEALVRLFGISSQQYPWTLASYPMPERAPPELAEPFLYWMVQQNLTALYLSVFEVLESVSGYGSLDRISAFEALRGMPKTDLALFFPDTPLQISMANGCGELYANVDAFVADNDRLMLDTEVVSVHRGFEDGYMVVDYRHVGAPHEPKQSLLARKLIVAAPPTLANVRFLDFDATDDGVIADPLYDLLAGVRTRAYFGFAISAQAGPMINASVGFDVLNLNIDLAVQPPQITYPALPAVVALKRDRTSGLITGWYVADNDTAISDADALAGIQAQLAKLPAYFLSNITVVAVTHHRYAPYFSQLYATAVNPYYALDRMQGVGGLYFAGALRAGANSPLVWDHAEGLIQHIRAAIPPAAADRDIDPRKK